MCKHVLTALAVFVLAALLSPADAWAESPDAAPVQVLDSVCYEAICLTYDAQVVGGGVTASLEPSIVDAWVAPEAVLFRFPEYPTHHEFAEPEIRVYSVSAWIDLNMSEFGYANTETLIALDRLLADRPLPIIAAAEVEDYWQFNTPVGNWSVIVTGKGSYLDAQNVLGVRYLGSPGQAQMPFTETSLVYFYRGFSLDGQYFIDAQFPVHAPISAGIAPLSDDWEAVDAFNEAYAHQLEGQSDFSFFPSLAALDAMMESFTTNNVVYPTTFPGAEDTLSTETFPTLCGCFYEKLSGVYPFTFDTCDGTASFTPGVIDIGSVNNGNVDGMCFQFSDLEVGPYDERGLLGILSFDAAHSISSCGVCERKESIDPLVIFIGGWKSHNSPEDPSMYLGFKDVRQAILDSPAIDGRIGADDFVYFSYSGEYYVSPAGTVDYQMPIYNQLDTMDLSQWQPSILSERMGIMRYTLTQLIQEFPERPIVIVAHSAGGVLATYWAATVPALVGQVRLIVTLDSPLQGTHKILSDLGVAAKIGQMPHLAYDHPVIRDLQAAPEYTRVFTVRHSRDVVVTDEQAALPGAWRDLHGDFGGNVNYRDVFTRVLKNPSRLRILMSNPQVLDEIGNVHGIVLHDTGVLKAIADEVYDAVSDIWGEGSF